MVCIMHWNQFYLLIRIAFDLALQRHEYLVELSDFDFQFHLKTPWEEIKSLLEISPESVVPMHSNEALKIS